MNYREVMIMDNLDTKEDVEKVLFYIDNYEMMYYLYKLDKNSVKIFNTNEHINYMYKVIEKIAEKNNLTITQNIDTLHHQSKSRDYVEENMTELRFNWKIHTNTQYLSFCKMFVILKDLLKVVENDFSLELDFYNNMYFMTKEEVDLRRRLSK